MIQYGMKNALLFQTGMYKTKEFIFIWFDKGFRVIFKYPGIIG